MKTLIKNGNIVNEGRTFCGSILIDGDHIENIFEDNAPRGNYDKDVDVTGCFVIPGVIDEHVHFRDPGLTRKATIESESRAAAYGGVTTFFDMPNTVPQTTTLEAWQQKMELGSEESHVNYSFFFGATNDNADLFAQLDATRLPGIKLFMGASTGNMLVDRRASLEKVFKTCAELNLPVMTHCEDTHEINLNMQRIKAKYGDDPDIKFHPIIRSAEACWESTLLAVSLARRFNTRLHVAHLTTARELNFFLNNKLHYDGTDLITAEAVLAHLLFAEEDYATRGSLIKCNPAVKTSADRRTLRHALEDGSITCIGTDHAPHELKDKQGGCAKAASGMPMLQFSLVSMLGLVSDGVLPIERMVELMCHNPARLFSVSQRGFLRKGYKADITIVRPHCQWTLTKDLIQSKCGWSPLEGERFNWRVESCFCNGYPVLLDGQFDEDYRGQAVKFRI